VTSSGYADAELAAMMSGLESDLVELTESWSNSTAEKVAGGWFGDIYNDYRNLPRFLGA